MDSRTTDFLRKRSRDISDRFPGYHRALVVETNDPLNMHRVRFKCAEFHDWTLKPEECPWAVPAMDGGGPRVGSWFSPCIGDFVWITFEKNHPYGPIWTGYADPTRRKMYSLPAVHTKTPLPVDKNGDPEKKQPEDYDEKYLPKDSRPMSRGVADRYGNLDISSYTGFFPITHKDAPPDPDVDAVQGGSYSTGSSPSNSSTQFKQEKAEPKPNDPDLKYMLRLSKYGSYALMADIGYIWQKKSDKGEFEGDPEKDDEWEIKRWKYLQKVITEDKTKEQDQRRYEIRTRYGHLFQMRDVGWYKARDGEYDDKKQTIGDKKANDQRWIKLRTKGGMLFQAMDMGSDPVEDEFVKRKILEEVGDKADSEDAFKGYDARMIRIFTRWGMKIVLDDRGSDRKDAVKNENPKALGMLFKGRRSPGSGDKKAENDPRGFFFEISEKDELNQTSWGTPLGITAQLNDRLQYALLTARKKDYSRPWKGLKDNEFLLSPAVKGDVEFSSHHLKLDLANEYIRFKTRAGAGTGPDGTPANPAKSGEPQGLECRDGSNGDGPWAELVDIDKRGLFFWGKKKLVVCRASQTPKKVNLLWWIDEDKKQIVIRNDESGKIQIYCSGDVEVIGDSSVSLYSKGVVNIRGDGGVNISGAGANMSFNGSITASEPGIGIPGSGGSPGQTLDPISEPSQIQPTDRGKRYNKDLEKEVDEKKVIRNPIPPSS